MVTSLMQELDMTEQNIRRRLKIVGFAKRLGVNPGIVVGQLQYRKLIPYTNFRPLLTTVRNLIIGNALTDGWSATATI